VTVLAGSPIVRTRGGVARNANAGDADPITTEVVRQGLNAAAEQMKVTLCRAAFSPVIYEMIDFAAGLFDLQFRMLAQARALPQFLGTLSFCAESAVTAQGGPERLAEGDVIWSTNGYWNGSHPQDAVVVVPIFLAGDLIGYAVTKAHQLDLAAKDPYCTDTTDNFQEGVIYPGVRLYAGGVQQDDMYRTVIANSRFPRELEGDLAAQIAAAHAGERALQRLVTRHGRQRFAASVERMYDHGEAVMRHLLERIPDGRYATSTWCDNDGVGRERVPFDIVVEVAGSDVCVDFTGCPAQTPGPINCPLATTVATARLAIMSLLGGADLPNEGHFRPIEVLTRPGTLFHPTPPAPLFLYGWPADNAGECIHRALWEALPRAVPAGCGGDICAVEFRGTDPDAEQWLGGADHVVGHGATHDGDGGSPMMVMSCSGIRTTPAEVSETRWPYLVEQTDYEPDSAGDGRYRGSPGLLVRYRLFTDVYMTAILERTTLPAWGLDGGGEGRPNLLRVHLPDGTVRTYDKVTRELLPAGSIVELHTGGGGGYGPAAERAPEAVHRDVETGYLTEAQARLTYPHAFP
jgi:N-methylhydantoinase B